MAKRDERMDKMERTEKIIGALAEKYPKAALALRYRSPLELLMAVILSAQCTDERVNQVTEKLFEKYRTPRDYMDAPVAQLEEDIRPTGFYRNKAKSLKACCLMLVETFGGEIPKDIDEMVRLPGVGRKTAAMVLGNAFGLHQGIAVDTHVTRVAQRLELTSAKTAEKIEQDLLALVPRDRWTWFSNAMILHGRETCTARSPRHQDCVIEKWCPYPSSEEMNVEH